MAIPVVYNLRSVEVRWLSALVAIFGIAGTVGVFVAMLSLARGFQATLISSGSPSNAIILRSGSVNELSGSVPLDQVKVVEDKPGIARGASGSLVSPEVVVVAAFPLLSTGTDANVQVRGVSAKALEVRNNVKIVKGRFFQPGLAELVVGRNVDKSYAGPPLGARGRFVVGTWPPVGDFDAGGSAFDSEVLDAAPVLHNRLHPPEDAS